MEEITEDLALADKNKDLEKHLNDLHEQLVALTDLNEKLKDKNIVKEQGEERIKVILSRKEKRRIQKAKKQAEQVKVPKTGINILFKEIDSEEWKAGRTVGNSKYKYLKHVMLGNGLIVKKRF